MTLNKEGPTHAMGSFIALSGKLDEQACNDKDEDEKH